MRILLLGGTGAMGIHLAMLLSKQGKDVFVTTRKDRMNKAGIIYLKGNAHDPSFIEEILQEGWDAIVDFMVYHTDEFAMRIDLLLKYTSQYVYLSSARVFANEEAYITERSPRLLDVTSDTDYLKTDEYALTKARQEDLLRASGYKNWTIVRPYITFSDIRLQLGVYEKEQWLYRVLQGRAIVFSKDIACHYTTLTYGEDVAQGIAGLIGNTMALSEDFNIVTVESLTWQEVSDIYVRTIEECTGIRPKVVYTGACLNLSFKRTQYQVRYCRLFDRKFDNRKILSVVPDLKFSDVRTSLHRCLCALINSRDFKPIGWGNEALLDRVSGEFTPMREIGGFKRYMVYLLLRKLPFGCVKYIMNHR
ncbi:NAD-dependent epimerase/dehydratase family protein [Parabacteroides sp. ZJ-118]|uniref:NAD-dependent epimerase/dehydratase family protein n=1 Tax=Parabacteroides sp. ZJ-118 TaxID=2709398 RepID=UPI0013EDB8F3|nr:NAD-dependent epimerase/dehydratase family protein [Parabacteroides sp. ZJ-118]